MFFWEIVQLVRSFWMPRPRGIQRLRRMEEDLAAMKEYAAILPDEGELDLIDKVVIKSKPFLDKLNLKNPP